MGFGGGFGGVFWDGFARGLRVGFCVCLRVG